MILATWNIGSALEKNILESIGYIADCVEKNSIDVLCLQEIITSGNDIDFINELKQRLSFEYSKYYELSSAHLENNAMMGIAIISKYKILDSFNIKLTNPNIIFKKGLRDIKSDDKGFLVAEILYKGESVKVATGHMLPFHSLGSDSREFKQLYQEMYSKVKTYGNNAPFVLCGDFNSSKLDSLIKDIYTEMQSVFNEPTRYNGNQNDYIFVSNVWICKSYKLDMNAYDHFLCVCEIDLRIKKNLRILHLSDIHYFSDDYSIDVKTKIPRLKESDVRKKLFLSRVKNIQEPLDYVIVSGDITTGGKTAGFKQFTDFVHLMQKEKIFPPTNHFVIVPGNHDVGTEDRWGEFSNLLDGSFARPWIENIDWDVQDLIEFYSRYMTNNHGNENIFGYIEDDITLQKIHFPFIIDIDKHVFIYAFNSSSISRTNIILAENEEEFINKLRSKKISGEMNKLLKILDNELMIDPARIDPQELFLFQEIVDIIEKYMDLTMFYKIAVLHHHTTTISCNEEVKKFDNIINAGILKKKLSDKGFQIIMHGHKHNAGIFYDTTIYNYKRILVISGGTVFGYPNGTKNGFYIHTIYERVLHSQFIYLDEIMKPQNIFMKLNGDIDTKFGLTLLDIYKSVENRLVQHINREIIDGREYIGWSKNIQDRKVGVIASVYGLLILEMLKSNNKYYIQKRDELINSLWYFRHAGGGWGAVSQITDCGAPEATAWVVLALFVVHSPLYKEALKDLYKILERINDNFSSNFTLSLIINILCTVDPDSKYILLYCEKLLGTAIRIEGKVKYWCSKCKENYIRKIEPSIVHTACAVIALYNSQSKGIISMNLRSDLSYTREILLNKDLWKNTHEAISVQIGSKEDSLIVHYYTISWVIRALLQMESFVDGSIIQGAYDLILKDYANGYWDYEGCFYIWTIYDALSALEAYLLNK